ncbi:16S rRNA (cytosine(1402)-N(4))-methyltransferase RsmH [Candidatus Odyssella thessalonicensis]
MHIPVLLKEMQEALAIRDGALYIDATFGGGGYTRAILEQANCQVIAVDRDPEAIQRAEQLKAQYPDRLFVFQGVFSDLPSIVEKVPVEKVDGVVFDFGVSSYQIDTPERGFSFRFEGPLDMRMSGEGESAADIVNTYSEEDLANVIYTYGEEYRSRRIARAIVELRKVKPIQTTLELANLIKSRVGGRPDAQHPATLTFQALRIKVNNELIEIERGLKFAEDFLSTDGRLVAVTFHSLEDRVVKSFLRQKSVRKQKQSRLLPGEKVPSPPSFHDLYPKGIAPSETEISANPRSRSARLRAAVRLPAHKDGESHA